MTDRRGGKYVRILVLVLSLFIASMVTYSFFNLEPKGTISAGQLVLIAILVVIILSENFDSFNIGRLLSMSRKIEEKDLALGRLNTENTELRKELVSVVASMTQNQSSTNIIGWPDGIIKKMGVEKATEDEVTKKREEEEPAGRIRPASKRINYQKLEEIALDQFVSKLNLTGYELVREAKLVTQFSGIDAISNIQPIYDGYINTGVDEIFIEIKVVRPSLIAVRERIYLMLNKIYLYNKVKKANSHLNLVLVDVDGYEADSVRFNAGVDRLKEFFEPSIVGGLLRVVVVKITEEQKANIYVEEPLC